MDLIIKFACDEAGAAALEYASDGTHRSFS